MATTFITWQGSWRSGESANRFGVSAASIGFASAFFSAFYFSELPSFFAIVAVRGSLPAGLHESLLQYQRIHAVGIVACIDSDHTVAVALIERQRGNVIHGSFQLNRAAFGGDKTIFSAAQQQRSHPESARGANHVDGDYEAASTGTRFGY